MTKNSIRRRKLKIIPGGLHRKISFAPVHITAAPENSAPFKVKALVFEEDTWLVMSANPTICEPEVHPIRLMTDVIEAVPEPVGSVKVKTGHPLRFLAIVHDVNQEPTWKEAWIEQSLHSVFREAEQRKISAIGLPLLGTLHGRLEKPRFAVILGRVLKQTAFNYLKQIWLVIPPNTNSEFIDTLTAELNTS
jgi:hypothetical protein